MKVKVKITRSSFIWLTVAVANLTLTFTLPSMVLELPEDGLLDGKI
jgi:hypothetical protein